MSHTFTICPHCKSVNKLSHQKSLQQAPICGKCQTKLTLHGLTSEVDTEGFKKIIEKSDKPVVVDFWASWCGPCRMYGPEFIKASAKNTDAVFVKVDTESEAQLSQQLGIRGIPCTILFKNGKEIARQSGAMSEDQLNQWLRSKSS